MCCLPTPMTLASGGSPMFPLVVHQPASPSIWSCRCSCMGSVSVSSCRCCMFVSCVHPVAVLNAGFCMTCSLLLLVEDARGFFSVSIFCRTHLGYYAERHTPEPVSKLPWTFAGRGCKRFLFCFNIPQDPSRVLFGKAYSRASLKTAL